MVKKLSKSLQIAANLNKDILNSSEYKEYLYYKKALLKHDELLSLDKQIKTLQQEIVQQKARKEDATNTINKYNELKELSTNHPLLVNYYNAKDELDNYTNSIIEEINGLLSLKGVD
ncbi:MAG: YlbF family regulator [Thomasclavelia sp.]|jgi:cell fate (sporulation/competence/biofilm development) regulator YlbF (YheA/YmcA/DUF963 family)|nr:YlbF family regulator [Thomasclavelia sp.]